MSVELFSLALAGALVIVQMLIAAGPRAMTYGLGWAAGPRDETPRRDVPERAKRADRAYRNLLETFPVFAAAAIGVVVADATTWVSALGAQLYFWARVIYLPAYVYHVPMVRSGVWAVAMLGIVLLLGSLLAAAYGGPA